MDFYLKYTEKIIGSVLLAGVVSSPVVSAVGDDTVNLGGLNNKEKRTGSSGTQQGLEDSANFDIKDSNQNFLSNNKKYASDVSAKDNLKAKKAPGDTDVKADKQTTKNLLYTANGPSNKEGESNGGKQIMNKSGYLKSVVNAVKNADPKVISAALLTPATTGVAGALAKKYLLNKDGKTAPISGPVNPDQDSNNENSNENDDPNTLQNESGNKKVSKLWWLILLVVPVILGLYKKKRVVNIDNNESDSDSNSDFQTNKNKKNQKNKKILNIYLNDNSPFENNIKSSINYTNKISNLNSKTNYNKYKNQFIPNSEELNDNKNDFEKDIKNNEEYIDKNDQNKSNNETKQFVKNNQLTIVNYNPKIERIFKKNLIENNRNKSILEMNVNFDNTDFFNPFDENLINKIIDKIKNGNEDENFEINNIKPPYEPKNFSKENNNNEQYAVKKLIKQSKNYINLLFEQFSKINIEFNNIAFCFILDCSLYLGIENKFIYLMIVLSILKIIQMFDIKFSILLTADDNFKVLIKKYDEKINYEDLIEKLYETYILKRYRNNLLKSVQIAVEYLKCNNIENRLFWIFSDCLDDSILQFNYWKNKVLINKNNAFIFFIEKTHNIPESKQKFLTEAWNNFEKKANEQSISKIKVIQNVKSIDDF